MIAKESQSMKSMPKNTKVHEFDLNEGIVSVTSANKKSPKKQLAGA